MDEIIEWTKSKVPGFFKQQTGQAYLLVSGTLWLFWKEGAPEALWWIVGGLGAFYIGFEKVRSIFAK